MYCYAACRLKLEHLASFPIRTRQQEQATAHAGNRLCLGLCKDLFESVNSPGPNGSSTDQYVNHVRYYFDTRAIGQRSGKGSPLVDVAARQTLG